MIKIFVSFGVILAILAALYGYIRQRAENPDDLERSMKTFSLVSALVIVTMMIAVAIYVMF